MAIPLLPAIPWIWKALAGTGAAIYASLHGEDMAKAAEGAAKDIKRGVSDFSNWVTNGVLNGIRSWSLAMSPRGNVGPGPNYDVITGRPIAVADATRIETPLLRQQIRLRPFGAPRPVRLNSNGEPIYFPWLSGSPERPIQLNPVRITATRVMRTDTGEAQPDEGAYDEGVYVVGGAYDEGAYDEGAYDEGAYDEEPPEPEPEQNQRKNKNKNKNNRFKDRQKKVFNNLKRGYGNIFTGLEYGIGFGAPILGAGYGIYKWTQPTKTRADSILDNLLYLVGELNKAIQINENLKRIDNILQLILNGSTLTLPTSTSGDTVKAVMVDPAVSTNVDADYEEWLRSQQQ